MGLHGEQEALRLCQELRRRSGQGQEGEFRVSFETSCDSKQPKLEPKPVSALSETKHLFRLFGFYTKTESFDVSIEPKQREDHRNSLIGSKFCYFVQQI